MQEEAEQHLGIAFKTDPTLGGDAPYFVRWLRHCYRQLVLLPEGPRDIDFARWVVMHLPEGLDQKFVRSVSRAVSGRAFGARAESYHRAAVHWSDRRTVLGSLLRDRYIWRDRELLLVHIEALLGSRVNRMLRRLRDRLQQTTGRAAGSD